MPVDLSSIDLASLIEQNASIRLGDKGGGNGPTRKGGPCPFCGLGTDRFAVFVEEVPQRYICGIHGNGCGAHGDALTFVREGLGIDDFYEACEFLSVDPGSEYSPMTRMKRETRHDKPPVKKWMDTAKSFCIEAKETLWSDVGKPALAWLRARGLTDKTIDGAGLGLNLSQGYQDAQKWGTAENVWVSRGITIPYAIGGDIWKVNIRRSNKDIAAHNALLGAKGMKENAAKYLHIKGSSNGLYGFDMIRPGQPLIIVEGELDCLSLRQSSSIASVATGSTANCHESKWLDAIQLATPILLAYDHDENNAGDNGARYWLKSLPQAVRWLPWAHDVNEMLTKGLDIASWVDIGISVCATSSPHIEEQETLPCADCGLDGCAVAGDVLFQFDALEGLPYCPVCWDRRQLSAPALDNDPMTHDQFLSIVDKVAAATGCTLSVDPPDYTDRAHGIGVIRWETKDYWQSVAACLEMSPRFHRAVIKDGKPMRGKPTTDGSAGNIIYSLDKPMMAQEEWNALRAMQLAERPDEARFAHYKGGYAGYCHMVARVGVQA